MYSQLYFDYNATTPCDKEVLEVMLPYFREHFGNPSSSHHPYGWLAKSAVEDSRAEIADALHSTPESLIFTSGATESINTILKGVMRINREQRNHILTTKVEHKAVLDTCAFLESEGFEVTYLDVDSRGLIRMEDFSRSLKPQTALVAVMYANNETGIIQPLEEIAALCAQNGSLLFSDTTQALGKVPLDAVLDLVDYACFSGHKVYGPKGIGLVYSNFKRGAPELPGLLQGGGQQRGQRGGTLNTPLIVGLAKAVTTAVKNLPEEQARLQSLRDRLDAGLSTIELARSNNQSVERLPNTSHFSFPFVDGTKLLNALSTKIAVSNGSACNSASVEPSHVLMAMGVERSLAYASLRLSIGRYTLEADIDKAVAVISETVSRERESNILWERRK
ncbi:MAG: cysteine desulfurase family protein [Robiginitalea sp.]